MGSVTSLLVDAFMVSRESPSDALQDISIKTRNVNLVLAADKSLLSKISPETYVKVRAAPSILQVVVVTQGLSVSGEKKPYLTSNRERKKMIQHTWSTYS